MEKLFDFSQQGIAETLLPKRIDQKVATAWVGHIPFAYYLVERLQPKMIVELGVHTGNSFLAFCDAVMELKLDCKCYGVDTFKGDKHAGFYGDDVYLDLMEHILDKGIDCATLFKETFDESLKRFEDSSIDILHIDGCHTYEDTKHNFETWKRKVKPDGLILFHDTVIVRGDFGVYRLWQEFVQETPGNTMNFIHSCGLGVLKHGAGKWEFNDPEKARKYFEDLGGTILHEYNFGKRMQRITGGIADVVRNGERKKIKKDYPTVCLTFICRDNETVISRMIKSCVPIIDYVVAVDTGSVDKTKDVIADTCSGAGVPFEIFQTEWKNFGHNRTLMMQYARGVCDYIFVMDSDETLEIGQDFSRMMLDTDVGMVSTSDGATTYHRDKFFKDDYEWKFIGAAHEFPAGLGASTKKVLPGLNLKLYPKQNNDHILRNYNLLLEDIKERPEDTRTLFYLGESAYDLGKTEEAIDYYTRRIQHEFFPEENWYAQYKLAKCYERLKKFKEAEVEYLKAYAKRPTRIEPMFSLAFMLSQNNDHARACIFYDIASRIPYPEGDMLFIEDYLYNYNCVFYYCISLYYAGKFQESFDLAEKVANEYKQRMPENVYNRHLLNIMYCENQLVKRGWKERFIVCPADLRFDGLGDNMLHSHLATLAKNAGYKKVYLSSLVKFKTPGTKELVYLNDPDVDGEIERYGLQCENQWAKNILYGDVPSFDMEYMKMIALSHGFYEEGKEYVPLGYTIRKGEKAPKVSTWLFDGYGKTNIANRNKVDRYMAKLGVTYCQITIDNTESDVHHSNANLKRIYYEGVREIHVKDIFEYYALITSTEKVICLTSATAIIRGGCKKSMETVVLTDTEWMSHPMARCHMRKNNKYVNLDKL